MEKWAEAEQKVILDFKRPRYKPQFFQLKKGGDTVWTNKGQTCLIVPFFKGTMEVLVRVLDSDAEYLIKWECGSILHLNEETGIRAVTGDPIFHYNLFLLEAGRAAATAAEGDNGYSETRGIV
jgi:hypothetical protein